MTHSILGSLALLALVLAPLAGDAVTLHVEIQGTISSSTETPVYQDWIQSIDVGDPVTLRLDIDLLPEDPDPYETRGEYTGTGSFSLETPTQSVDVGGPLTWATLDLVDGSEQVSGSDWLELRVETDQDMFLAGTQGPEVVTMPGPIHLSLSGGSGHDVWPDDGIPTALDLADFSGGGGFVNFGFEFLPPFGLLGHTASYRVQMDSMDSMVWTPEPSTAGLLAAGLAVLAAFRRSRP